MYPELAWNTLQEYSTSLRSEQRCSIRRAITSSGRPYEYVLVCNSLASLRIFFYLKSLEKLENIVYGYFWQNKLQLNLQLLCNESAYGLSMSLEGIRDCETVNVLWTWLVMQDTIEALIMWDKKTKCEQQEALLKTLSDDRYWKSGHYRFCCTLYMYDNLMNKFSTHNMH